MSPSLRLFALGLPLGGAAVWLAPRPASGPGPAAAPPGPPPAVVLSAWSWRNTETPSLLAGPSVSAAISAWLALRGPDGKPAGLALRLDAMRALLVRLPTKEFPRLMTPLAARETPKDRELLLSAFYAWVELDAVAAASWAGTVADSPGLDPADYAIQAGRVWVRDDPFAVVSWACSLPDEARAIRVAGQFLPAFAKQDPTRALALASTRSEEFADKLLPSLLPTMAKSDPAGAVRTHGPRLWREGAGFEKLRDCLCAWTEQDPAAALAWLVAQPRPRERPSEWASLSSELSDWIERLRTERTDLRAFATALTTLPEVPHRQNILGRLLFDWGLEKPTEAIAWLDALPDRNLRTVLIERASNIMNPDKPQNSLPLALAMAEGEARVERLSRLLSQWAKLDSTAALAWIKEHDEPAVTAAASAARASILGVIAADEPGTALAEWAILPDEPTKTAALAPIAEAWGKTDPAAAFQWLTEQRAARKIGDFESRLFYAWSKKAPLDALRWAEEADHGPRFLALIALRGHFDDRPDPVALADLYAQIRKPEIRIPNLTMHLQQWFRDSPAAARAWIESHEALSPAQAAAILGSTP